MKTRDRVRWAIAIALFLIVSAAGVIRAEIGNRRISRGWPNFFAPPGWYRQRLLKKSVVPCCAGLVLSCTFLLVSKRLVRNWEKTGTEHDTRNRKVT